MLSMVFTDCKKYLITAEQLMICPEKWTRSRSASHPAMLCAFHKVVLKKHVTFSMKHRRQ